MILANQKPTTIDLAWAAGFLEGEGSFGCWPRQISVRAVQVHRESLERLQALFGGGVRVRRPADGYYKTQYLWSLTGSRAVGLMFTLFTWLTPYRRQQIKRAISTWKKQPSRAMYRTHCPQGHAYDKKNTYRAAARPTHRLCRACNKRRAQVLRDRAK